MIVQIVLGVLRTVPVKLAESTEKLEIEDIIKSLQTAVLLRRVSNLYDPDKDYKYPTQNKAKSKTNKNKKQKVCLTTFSYSLNT